MSNENTKAAGGGPAAGARNDAQGSSIPEAIIPQTEPYRQHLSDDQQ